VAASALPVLGANLRIEGARQGEGAWSKWLPWMVKEVGGFRIGLVGLTTPGLPYWLAPETLGGIAALDPAAALRAALGEMRDRKPDAVVVLGHMGWRFQDDFANPVREILRTVPGVDVYLAGHSHQDQPSWTLHGVLCSQANYHGIHCGRVDLTFDQESRKLLDRRAFTVLMDGRFAEDPAVLREAGDDLARSAEELGRKVCELKEGLGGRGRGSALAGLFCEAFADALQRAGEPVDGVFHGTFGTGDVAPGPVTVGDVWQWIPYENQLVVGELTGAQLIEVVAEDAKDSRSDRTLWPFELEFEKGGKPRRFLRAGAEVADLQRRFRIAFNSYDAQSGGQRLLRLRELLAAPGARRRLLAIDTRGALLGHLLEMGSR
jgi:2',3'-cyclic-nucleotide 2'-phosphodiesterase (5'-nucleotidase family)